MAILLELQLRCIAATKRYPTSLFSLSERGSAVRSAGPLQDRQEQDRKWERMVAMGESGDCLTMRLRSCDNLLGSIPQSCGLHVRNKEPTGTKIKLRC